MATTATIDLNDAAYADIELRDIYGPSDCFIEEIKRLLSVTIDINGKVLIRGEHSRSAREVLLRMLSHLARRLPLSMEVVTEYIQSQLSMIQYSKRMPVIEAGKLKITAKTPNQATLHESLNEHLLNFAIGPAGTGKTLITVMAAVRALQAGEVDGITVLRPAVEAGEKLGFLPGDEQKKLDPYLRPIFDALAEILGFEETNKLVEAGIIEISALAFLRGRTFKRKFVILDEAQNTSVEQMKMFVTRLGYGSKMAICGDTAQIDLPKGIESGLKYAIDTFYEKAPSPKFTFLDDSDCHRHPIVEELLGFMQ